MSLAKSKPRLIKQEGLGDFDFYTRDARCNWRGCAILRLSIEVTRPGWIKAMEDE